MENLEEILIHMFYALESNEVKTYVKLRELALKLIAEKNSTELIH
ncbi:MAG: hypothetical protein ACK4VO_13160 [Pseudobdellovibrio sp.]